MCLKLIVLICVLNSINSTLLNDRNSNYNRIVGIINGEIAKPKQFPYNVGIILHTRRGIDMCGGSLIGKKWVLTSGKCTFGSDIFYVYLGCHNLFSPDSNCLLISTTKYITHEGYNATTLDNDIGLIEFNAPINFTDYIQPVQLTRNKIGSDIVATIAGWGLTGDSKAMSDELLYTTLTTIDNSNCVIYGSFSDRNLCAKARINGGFCKGDFGAALTINDQSPIQIGIASQVSPTGCESGDPFAFVRVSKYRDWIQEKTGV